jgi:hypothetical protein
LQSTTKPVRRRFRMCAVKYTATSTSLKPRLYNYCRCLRKWRQRSPNSSSVTCLTLPSTNESDWILQIPKSKFCWSRHQWWQRITSVFTMSCSWMQPLTQISSAWL